MPFRVIILLSSFLLASLPSLSQNTETDSLESLVKSLPTDTNKVWLLNQLVTSLREKDNNKAFGYATQARDLAELLTDKRGLAMSLENLGWILYRKGDYSKSFDLSAEALRLNEEIDDPSGMARCLINIAAIHYEQKQYDIAINHFRKAYWVSHGANDIKTMARSLNNIGYSFHQFNNPDSAFHYANLAYDLSKSVGDAYMIAFSLRTLGDVHEKRKQYDEALDKFQQCLNISVSEGNIFLKVSTLHRIGKVYMETGNLDMAVSAFLKNIQVGEEFGYKEELERTYKLLAETYDLKKDVAKAYAYQSRYVSLHDSLYDQRQNEKMTLLQARFNAEMTETQIELLMKETALNEEEIKSQKMWLYFSVGCLSLLIILAFVLFYTTRYNSLAKRQLQEKNRAINTQTQQLRNLNATKDKLFSIISHDLRSPLASLKALMELVGTPGLTHDEFVNITRILKRNLDSVHEDLDNLLLWAQTQLKGLQAMPEPLELKILADEKITLFKEAANSKNISIQNEINPGTVVIADKNHIGLVLRNLIANAIKFNMPGGKIVIDSKESGSMYEVSVMDSGVGISIDDIPKLFNAETHFTRPGTNKEKGVGIGLLITKEFVENNQGSIWVTSELGKGTTFTFSLKASAKEFSFS
jgi:two-component system, sensor histidine kinase and response regulator